MDRNTDFSFMKSGFSSNTNNNNLTNDDTNNVMALITLFSSKSIENALNYVEYCGRNGVTKDDMVYALRYEVFEFMNNNNMERDLNDILDDMEEEDIMEDDGDSEWEDIDDLVVPDGELNPFSRITDENVNDNNREFIEKMHTYYDTWDDWEPQTPLEKILKRAINISNGV